MAVSLIQSNASGFGSWLVEPMTGINLHNRGLGFNVQAGHPAEYRPGRRPPHTLCPAMATRDGRLVAVFGTMGGDAQPQILLQLMARLFAGREGPASAVAAARWVLRRADDGIRHVDERASADGDRRGPRSCDLARRLARPRTRGERRSTFRFGLRARQRDHRRGGRSVRRGGRPTGTRRQRGRGLAHAGGPHAASPRPIAAPPVRRADCGLEPAGPFRRAQVDGRVLDSVTAHGKHLFAAFGDRVDTSTRRSVQRVSASGERPATACVAGERSDRPRPPRPVRQVLLGHRRSTGAAGGGTHAVGRRVRLERPARPDGVRGAQPVGGRCDHRPARSGPPACGQRRRQGLRADPA